MAPRDPDGWHGPERRQADRRHPAANGIDLHAPGGWRLTATGPLVIIILLLAVGFGSLGYILDKGFQAIATDSDVRQREHQSILTSQNEMACVLALPQEARPASLADPRGICHYATMIFQYDSGGRRVR